MPKKKKVEDSDEIIVLEGNYNSDSLIQKSRPLLTLWKSNCSLSELKIIDIYLSRINSHNPEQRTIKITKGELEKLYGVKKINAPELKQRLQKLGRFINYINEENKIDQIALFERITCEKDKESGLWTAELTCTPSARKYIFNIENIGYLKYNLNYIAPLSSIFSYYLFIYLEDKRSFFDKIHKDKPNKSPNYEWEVEISELKQVLSCGDKELYNEYFRFKQKVLEVAQAELRTKLNYQFSFEGIRTGRKTTKIKFTVAKNQTFILDSLPETISSETEDLLFGACGGLFTREQQENILKIASQQNYTNEDERWRFLNTQYNLLMSFNESIIMQTGKPIEDMYSFYIRLLSSSLQPSSNDLWDLVSVPTSEKVKKVEKHKRQLSNTMSPLHEKVKNLLNDEFSEKNVAEIVEHFTKYINASYDHNREETEMYLLNGVKALYETYLERMKHHTIKNRWAYFKKIMYEEYPKETYETE